MRNLLIVVAIFLFNCSSLFGQDPPRSNPPILVHQSGFVLESLSGYGFASTAHSPIFNIASGNPASLSNFDQIAAGFSHQANSKIEPHILENVSFQRVNNLIPQSAGIVYPVQNLRVAAGYSQRYSAQLRFEDIPITTPQYPDGTGEFYSTTSQTTIYSFSGVASYPFHNVFSEADQFSVGFQFNMNLLIEKSVLYRSSAKLTDEALNWKLGLRYTHRHQSIEKLQLGIAYESKFDFSGYYDYLGADLLIPRDPSVFRQIPSTLTYPANLKLGWLFQPTSRLGIYSDLIYNFWEDMYQGISNKLDVSGGVFLNAAEWATLSLGAYMRQSYSRDPLTGMEREMKTMRASSRLGQFSGTNGSTSIWRWQTATFFPGRGTSKPSVR